jgi:hypothetical protein
MEFACRVTNYPECENFEREVTDVRVLDMFWQQGAGIYVGVCGYSTLQQLVLLQLQYVAYLGINRKTYPDNFTNNVITFNNNIQDSAKLVAPFLEQLSLFDGCRFSTMELLWKYYQALHTLRKHERSQQQQRSGV